MKQSLKTALMHETIADISYMAGSHGYYSGDSRADMQLFILLAKKFFKQYASEIEAGWEEVDMDYIDEIEKFVEKELGLKKNILKFTAGVDYPAKNFEDKWDDVEVHPVYDDGKNVSVCEEGEETYWSAYLHRCEGGVMCIGDFKTKDKAILFKDILDTIKKSYCAGSFALAYTLRRTISNKVNDTDHYEVFTDGYDHDANSPYEQAKKRKDELIQIYDSDESDTELYCWNICPIMETSEHYQI